jgi:hypothetical protein
MNKSSTRLGVTQKGNLRFFEQALRKHWRLGQNIVLCWCPVEKGVLLLFVPHYFLSSFSESLDDCHTTDRLGALNGQFIRKLISGRREMSEEDFYGTARRFELNPTYIELPVPIIHDADAINAIDEMIKRYSISYVDSRAVLLFDIVDFSLFSPFEQASQLNSLSYSLNSAYNKMQKANVDIDFARTTTGDGFYIWNREEGALANVQLFHFMLLVIADNAIAKRKAQGNTVPVIKTGFHVGSHYEFNQSEGLNPTMYSYIVGEVTIELARMLDGAQPGQIYIGDFITHVPTSAREGAYLIEANTIHFVERAKKINDLRGVEIAGEETEAILSYLTGETGASGGESIRRFRITDKHGFSRHAYNLRINIYRKGMKPLILGLQDSYLPKPAFNRPRGFLNYDFGTTTIRPKNKRHSPVHN